VKNSVEKEKYAHLFISNNPPNIIEPVTEQYYNYIMNKVLWSKFNKPQTISEILRNIGLIFFASMSISPFFGENTNWVTIIIGILISLGFWASSLILTKE